MQTQLGDNVLVKGHGWMAIVPVDHREIHAAAMPCQRGVIFLGKALFRQKVLSAQGEENVKRGKATEGCCEIHAAVMSRQGRSHTKSVRFMRITARQNHITSMSH